MKKNSFFKSLPFKLLVGVILGIVLGLVLNSTDGSGFTAGVLNVSSNSEIYSRPADQFLRTSDHYRIYRTVNH